MAYTEKKWLLMNTHILDYVFWILDFTFAASGLQKIVSTTSKMKNWKDLAFDWLKDDMIVWIIWMNT